MPGGGAGGARGDAEESVAPAGISVAACALGEQPDARYECPICLNWLREPVVTTCGHRFCRSCITSWLQNSGHCPIDNVNLTMKVDIFPDNFTRREIQEQRTTCPHAVRGCQAKVAPLDLDSHLASCSYARQEEERARETRLPCSFHNLGCTEMLDNQESLTRHHQDGIQNHMSLLMNAYSELKLAGELGWGGGAAGEGEARAQEAMSLWEPPDKNKPAGAEDAAPLNNTSALIRALYERVVMLEQRTREQEIVLSNLSKQVSSCALAKRKLHSELSLRYCMGNYVWRVDNFRARLEAMLQDHTKMLYSPGFYTSPTGYRFCVRLNVSSANPGYLALLLHLMRSEWDECLEWPYNGRISIAMINQVVPELTQRDTMMSNSQLTSFQRPQADLCLRGFGYSEYASVADVLSRGFLLNDTLIIRVTLKSV